MAVDKLKLSRTLQADGDFTPKQAEALAAAFGAAEEMPVTKADLKSAVADLQKEMAGLEVRLGDRIAGVETRTGDRVASLETRIGDRINRALGLQTITIIMAIIGGLYALRILGR